MLPHGIDDLLVFGADDEAKLQHCAGVAGNGVGRLVDIARRHRQHFQRVPGIEPLGRRQPLLAPIVRQRRLVRRRLDLDVGEHAADRVGDPRRLQRVELHPALAVDELAIAFAQDRRGIGEHAAPIAGMMPAFAQIHVEMDADAAAAAEEDGRTLRRQPRPVGGEKQVGLQFLAQGRADLAQIGRADLLAGLDDEFGVEAELAAARLAHRAQRRQIDAVLALVVGGAAAIDALALMVVCQGSRLSRHSPSMPSTTSPWP